MHRLSGRGATRTRMSGGTVSLVLSFAFVGLLARTPQSPSASKNSPGAPTPSFHLYRMKVGQGLVSVVVPPKTTDDELKKLLWHFREKVRTGKFKDIGITRPTNTNRLGRLDYGAGMIIVYRGEKCAIEPFLDSLGPCGYGEHDAGSYQWGVHGDPNKDDGVIKSKQGDLIPVFDYTDDWRPN